MRNNSRPGLRCDIVLILSALLAVFLNTFKIWENSTANAYYTAAVTSMLQSWHNFFFASLDPAGFITVDKPPVVFWVQTAFAYVFGVHGWSVILPQALAGVGSVLLIYSLVKPKFGKTAARWAGLIMASSPIAVAVSRTNNIDSLLVFTLLLATWMLFRGIYIHKYPWILGAFAVIGVGFNMKMLQAYMVVPAFYLFYLLAFKSEWKRKLAILAAATVILVGVTLSWAVIVDSIPADNRPYIGGSKTNSVLELALGYNGINRLTGMGGPGGGGSAPQDQPASNQESSENPEPRRNDQFSPPVDNTSEGFSQGGPPPGNIQGSPPQDFNSNNNADRGPVPGGDGPQGLGKGGGGGAFGTGQAGPLRLFQKELSGQISWLLPLVGFACFALLAGIRPKRALMDKEKEALFWLAWLLPAAIFFSIAGFYHHYYLIMLAPPIAALAGTGWVEMGADFQSQQGWKKCLLPLVLLVTTVFELYIMYPYRTQIGLGWLIGIGGASLAVSVLLLLTANKERLFCAARAAGMVILLVGPLYWATTPLIYGDNNVMPQVGPGQKTAGQPAREGVRQAGTDQLIDYISKNSSSEKYFLMTSDTGTAESYIISTGKAVVATGGFSGSDPALTVEKLEHMVQNKEVKYFLFSSGSDSRGRGGNNDALSWIRAHCTEVPREDWQSSSSQPGGKGQSMTLYQISE